MNGSISTLLGGALLAGAMALAAAPVLAHRDYPGAQYRPGAPCPDDMEERGAPHPHGMYGRHHRPFGEQHLERLDELPGLDAEQRKAIRAIVDGARPALRELSDRLHDTRRAMHRMMHDGNYEREAFAKLAAAQGETIGKLIAARADVRARALAVLTEEQRSALRDHRWDDDARY